MRKPIAVILTDTHFKENNISMVEDIFYQTFELCKKKKINTVIHGGDFFQYRLLKFESSLKCFLSMCNVLQRAKQEGIKILAIQGNHDKPDLNAEKGYMSIIQNPGSLELFEKEGIKRVENVLFCFLPYFTEGLPYLSRLLHLIELKNEYMDDFGYTDDSGKDLKIVLITHASINGVKNNDGTVVDGDLETQYFDEFDLIISGHYHNFQKINNKTIYIGSSHQSNFGEDEYKGFKILHDDLTLSHVDSKSPKFVKLVVDVEDQDSLDQLENLDKLAAKDDKVQIVLKGSEDKLATFDRKNPLLKGKDVRYEAKEKEVMFQEVEEIDFNVFNTKNIAKSWIEYAKIKNIPNDMRGKGLKLLTTLSL